MHIAPIVLKLEGTVVCHTTGCQCWGAVGSVIDIFTVALVELRPQADFGTAVLEADTEGLVKPGTAMLAKITVTYYT